METRQRFTTGLLGFTVLFLTFVLIAFAESAFTATMDGLKLFALVVLPSLLPFFIVSELLYGTGMVHFLGVLFEPMMRPLFNVPGIGSFVLSMGLAAGYPMDAVLTAKFRRDGLCTRIEAERMLAFSNTADPLFIFGAVAVGMFTRPEFGLVLAIAHYSASFAVGVIYRFHGLREEAHDHPARSNFEDRIYSSGGMIRRAFRALYQARAEDGRSLGTILNEAIAESTQTLIKIGCFIVLFAVLLRMLDQIGAGAMLEAMLAPVLSVFGISSSLSNALLQGIFEIDLGSQAASVADAPMYERLIIASAIIAWSGLSVHGQVASILTGTDIRLLPYVIARLIHAVLAALFTLAVLLVNPSVLRPPSGVSRVETVWTAWAESGTSSLGAAGIFWHHLQLSLKWSLVAFALLLLTSLALFLWQSVKQRSWIRI